MCLCFARLCQLITNLSCHPTLWWCGHWSRKRRCGRLLRHRRRGPNPCAPPADAGMSLKVRGFTFTQKWTRLMGFGETVPSFYLLKDDPEYNWIVLLPDFENSSKWVKNYRQDKFWFGKIIWENQQFNHFLEHCCTMKNSFAHSLIEEIE